MRFHWQERDGIDKRWQRRVVGVVPNLLGNIFAMSLELPDCTRSNKISVKALTASDRTADLGLVHGLRRSEAAKMAGPQIIDRQRDDGGGNQATPNPN